MLVPKTAGAWLESAVAMEIPSFHSGQALRACGPQDDVEGVTHWPEILKALGDAVAWRLTADG